MFHQKAIHMKYIVKKKDFNHNFNNEGFEKRLKKIGSSEKAELVFYDASSPVFEIYYRGLDVITHRGKLTNKCTFLFELDLVKDRDFYERVCFMIEHYTRDIEGSSEVVEEELVRNSALKYYDEVTHKEDSKTLGDASTKETSKEVYPVIQMDRYLQNHKKDLVESLRNENNSTYTMKPVTVVTVSSLLYISAVATFVATNLPAFPLFLGISTCTCMSYGLKKNSAFARESMKDKVHSEKQLDNISRDIEVQASKQRSIQTQEEYVKFIDNDLEYLKENGNATIAYMPNLLLDLRMKYCGLLKGIVPSEIRFDYLKTLISYEITMYYSNNISTESATTISVDRDSINERIDFLDLDGRLLNNRMVTMLLEDIYSITDKPYKGSEYEILLLFKELVSVLERLYKESLAWRPDESILYRVKNNDTLVSQEDKAIMDRVASIKRMINALKNYDAMDLSSRVEVVEKDGSKYLVMTEVGHK